MSKTSQKRSHARRKIKAGTVMPMCLTAGFFLGFGLGALMGNVLPVTLAGLLIGAAIAYKIDKRNNIPYTRRK